MKNKLRYLLTTIVLMTLSACAQNPFTALEQQQVSIQDTTLFEQFDAFTVDFAAMERDYSFPLPVGRARQVRDYLVEIDTRSGDAVKAMFPGRVRLAKNGHESLGHVIVIRHDNGLETVYGHNAQLLVKTGDWVRAGQVIALTGQTGRATTPHLHFETRINGQAVNSTTYFDHTNHTLRLEAFSKKKDGYVIKRR